MAKVTTVRQPAEPEKQVPTEVLASSIVAIAEGVRKLRAGPLNDKALFLLIQHAAPNVGRHGYTPLSIKDIRATLDGIDALEETFIRKPNKNAKAA